MELRSIVVHLDGTQRGAELLRVASRIAVDFKTHLAAVFATETPLLAASAMDASATVMIDYQIEIDLALAKVAKSQVTAAQNATGLAIEWRPTEANMIGNLALHARHADLLVMGQENPQQSRGIGPSMVASVVMGAGRPVLLIPYAGTFDRCGESVLISWNAGREATRAVADALPLLKRAREVNIVSFNPDEGGEWGEIPGADIGLWLARHDVRVTVHQCRSKEIDIGNQLLSRAADFGSDLIVMGAYGHSRAYELMLGGVTRTLLRSMTVPVLMSH